ncbi:interleukin-6 receptor subunit beta [Phyllostomus hastatus]|uniref:interleukin-6 receptor subunit beta n=1 Tax=Phyllostomus hastatus TaxID=9423 RepID=UPI001E6803D1|nr:interleukin-6 receptor subunit beta [Phyllostomus hastatus]XP_045695830.1 interleukin-6 receptor subunit beta [Phyllostomus hastatus]XP_045695832.1 interleukin-6 receptor subunit beta [Phyllostomus hastatus]XP_045695833.1 interleukin-6 receptor subunit beta [Phyllostomus hastatus]
MPARPSWTGRVLFLLLTVESLGELVDPCGSIVPEAPVVPLGSNFTAVCVLKEQCMRDLHVRAEDIFWKTDHVAVPRRQYAVLNSTAASVTLAGLSLLSLQLTCNVRTFGQLDQNVYGIHVTAGLPPEKPENLSCVVPQGRRMTCQWDAGRETHLDTNFTLKSEWATEKFADCRARREAPTSCTVDYSPVYFVNLEVWVEAENALGRAVSAHLNFDPVDKVRPNPPHNLSVSSSEELSSILKLTWVNPSITEFMQLKYDIQYRTRGASTWTQIPPEDTASTRSSFTVQDLRPFTEHVFRVRCTKADGRGYWSAWSEEASGTTCEDRPSKAPSFWYKTEQPLAHGSRSVRLLWKTLPPFEANGRILDYEVTLWRGKAAVQNHTVNSTRLTVSLTGDRYRAALTARNGVGRSDAATLTIPACDFRATRPVRDLRAFPKDSVLWVEWTAPGQPVTSYILEWCVLSDRAPCVPDWQQEDGAVNRAALTGALEESKCYLITVTPVYADGPGLPESTRAYLKQAPPSKGPTVRTKKVGKNEAVLEWDRLPVDVQNGFIRNYTIFYKTSAGNETAVRVDPSHTDYTLSSLTSDTLYMVRMAAYTDEGGKDGPEFTFTTPKFAQGEIEAIVVPVCLAFLLVTLLGVLVCFNKRDLIKKHIWPNVPDPSKSHIAQWSPHTPPRHNFSPKEQMCSDSSVTDVSIVEIEASDRKPPPEDLKSLDLFRKDKAGTEGHSSGIGGSSCLSSSRPSICSSEDSESARSTASAVQYSTVVHGGYRHQAPPAQAFSRSESTQPLLDSEERPEELPLPDVLDGLPPGQPPFQQSGGPRLPGCGRGSPFREEDFVPDLAAQPPACGLGKAFPEALAAGALGPGPEGPGGGLEAAGAEAELDEGVLKSYLPQTVRRGGYMPQ